MVKPDEYKLAAGTLIGEFRIERLIGRGAMGMVYRAIQTTLERPIALKVLPRELALNEDFVDRFFNEARAAAAFSHPNIVQAYDAGITDDDVCYLAMEFVEGETLEERIEHEGRLPALAALRIGLDIAQALDYGWKHQHLTHGDIKPANIMITTQNQIKLADFGLAKTGTHKTGGEGIMLTPLYAAPELIQGLASARDCRADIYSFGATLYHALTGMPPFPGEDADEVMQLQVSAPLTPAIERSPDLPRRVSDFLGLLLAKHPDERPHNWEEVISSIKDLTHRLTRTVQVAVPAERQLVKVPGGYTTVLYSRLPEQKSRTLAWSVIAGLGILLIVLLIILRQISSPARPVPQEDAMEGVPSPPLTTWHELHRQLQAETDPAKNIELLRQFRLSHLGEYPETAYNELLQSYRQAAAGQTGDTPRPPEEPPQIALPLPPPEEPAAGESVVPQTAPPTGEDVPPAATTPAQGGLTENQYADDYVRFLYQVNRYRFTLEQSAEMLRQKCQEWLAAHKAPFEAKSGVEFLQDTVAPALEKVKPLLISHSQTLAGQRLPGFENEHVRGAIPRGLQVAVFIRTEDGITTGSVSRVIPWSSLTDPIYAATLGTALMKAGVLAPGEMVPLLAFFLVNGFKEELRQALEKIPNTAEQRAWRKLAIEIEAAPREQAALELWESAQQAAAQGAFEQAYSRIETLRTQPNAVAVRYAEAIRELAATCAPHVPKVQAEQIMANAVSQVREKPEHAVVLLTTLSVRYGRLDFEGRNNIERLRDTAAAALAQDLQESDRNLGNIHRFNPLLSVEAHRPFGFSAAQLQTIIRSPATPPELRRHATILRGLVLLELGDWDAAAGTLKTVPASEARNLPERICVARLLAELLLLERLQMPAANPDYPLRALNDCWNETQSPRDRYWYAALTAEYAVAVGRAGDAADLPWPALSPQMETVHDMRAVLQYAVSQVMLATENGNAAAANAAAGFLHKYGDRFQGAGGIMSPAEWEGLLEYLRFLETGERTAEQLPSPPAVIPQHCVHLLLTALSQHWPTAAEPERKTVEWLARYPVGRGPLAGRNWFAALLILVSQDITDGNLEDMQQQLTAALALLHPDVTAYYARLRLLEAGVALLNGNRESAKESLDLIRLCTSASPAERQAATLFERPPRPQPPAAAASADRNQAYLEAWLQACHWYGSGAMDRARLAAAAMIENADRWPERLLAESLLAFFNQPVPAETARP
jgi:serine/threonine protein kinase